ncbi:MAG: adenine deaminase C-terminal domain-containing protein, partial [Parabacteroides sp.]
LKHGAFASSVAHDSHNIIAVGCSDREIAGAINQIIEERGGLSVQLNDKAYILPLPIGGIMSDKDGKTVSTVYKSLYNKVNEMGCNLRAPFMTLAFMSLLVIPEIKIGEKGLFSYSKFYWIE